LPAKKRRVLLTKESLDAMTEEQQKIQTKTIQPPPQDPATVSEDSLSNASDNQAAPAAARAPPLGRLITNDVALTQKALTIRNEEERMRVARAMLYDAYQKALRGE